MTALHQPMAEPLVAPRRSREVFYPSSDGKPMAETDWHWMAMVDMAQMLQARYREHSDAYIASNNFLYFVEGDPRKVISPDVYVVFGVPKRKRRIFKLWEEGVPPAVVFEFTSRKTRREDLGKKRDIYAWLGVDEYFLCDPESDYLKPPLQGFWLDPTTGVYRPLAPDASGRLASTRLGLHLWLEDGKVQVADAVTGEQLMRSVEVREREREAERLVEEERDARRAAEAEIVRLRAEIERLRGEGGG